MGLSVRGATPIRAGWISVRLMWLFDLRGVRRIGGEALVQKAHRHGSYPPRRGDVCREVFGFPPSERRAGNRYDSVCRRGEKSEKLKLRSCVFVSSCMIDYID